MKWTKEENEKVIQLLKNGNDFETIGKLLNRSKKSIKEKINDLGYKQSDYVIKNSRCEKECKHCKNKFISLISEKRKFCSSTCSVTFNNLVRGQKYHDDKSSNCINCGLISKNNFCSITCSHEYKRKEMFKLIESGDTSLISKKYKQYLIHIHGEKCMECGWCSINPTSNKVPIELEHIDGNSENNSLDNLKLLCPNCHSLTSTYKALNKGNGRHNRMIRYNNGKSY